MKYKACHLAAQPLFSLVYWPDLIIHLISPSLSLLTFLLSTVVFFILPYSRKIWQGL